MKKILCVAAVLLLILMLPVFGSAQENVVTVYVDGECIPTRGILYSDSTLMPARAFLEKIGFSVSWFESADAVYANRGEDVIEFAIGGTDISLNGSKSVMNCPALEIDGVSYVSVRSVGELMGYTVSWYPVTSCVVLSDSVEKYEYYEDAPAPMPELGSVVGGEGFSSVSRNSEYGICYSYKGYVEDKAHEYGDVLTSAIGYSYDSMLLTDNYGKLYVYNFGDIRAAVGVESINSVPYIHVYPDIDGTASYEYPADQETRPDENAASGEYECYPGTDVPTYAAVCSVPMKMIDSLSSGEPVYIYDSSAAEAMIYMNFLSSIGYYNYDMDIGSGFTVTYTLVRDGKFVVVMTSMLSGEVYIVPGK